MPARPAYLRHDARDPYIPWQVWTEQAPVDPIDRHLGYKHTYLSGHRTAPAARAWAEDNGYRITSTTEGS